MGWLFAIRLRSCVVLAAGAARSPCSPGMPAEVYVTTAERTLVEYLAKPLGLFFGRAMREQ